MTSNKASVATGTGYIYQTTTTNISQWEASAGGANVSAKICSRLVEYKTLIRVYSTSAEGHILANTFLLAKLFSFHN